MKTKVTQLMNPRIGLNYLFVILLSVFLVSCEKDEMNTADSLNAKAAAADDNNASPAPTDVSIAGIVSSNDNFEYLLEALIYVDVDLNAGLVPMFSSTDDQYTVFAPTDAAFLDLLGLEEEGNHMEEIRTLPAELVLAVLKYHVTDGRRGANSVVPKKNNKSIQTLLGEKFEVTPAPEIIAIGNTANFEATDISASNGIIHIIDSVLLPIE
jgi:uncharacterized surface protein with fasciclin (FAS1) repeats